MLEKEFDKWVNRFEVLIKRQVPDPFITEQFILASCKNGAPSLAIVVYQLTLIPFPVPHIPYCQGRCYRL